MESQFEKQTLEKLKIILYLLEDTLNNKGGFEVRISDLDGKKVMISEERERYLEVGIENCIIGLKDAIQSVEDRKSLKEKLTLIINNKKRN